MVFVVKSQTHTNKREKKKNETRKRYWPTLSFVFHLLLFFFFSLFHFQIAKINSVVNFILFFVCGVKLRHNLIRALPVRPLHTICVNENPCKCILHAKLVEFLFSFCFLFCSQIVVRIIFQDENALHILYVTNAIAHCINLQHRMYK